MTSSAREMAFGSEPAASKPGAGGLSAAWPDPGENEGQQQEQSQHAASSSGYDPSLPGKGDPSSKGSVPKCCLNSSWVSARKAWALSMSNTPFSPE